MNRLVDEKLAQGKIVSLKPDVVGLLVFGGMDPLTKSSNYYDAYAIAFSPEKNLAAWAVVGAAPLTRKCLESDKITHNSESDPQQVQYEEIENTNHNACHLLIAKDYNGDMLKVLLKKKEKKTTVANPRSDVQWVADSKLYGMKFIWTGADHLCTDLNFNAAELTTHCGKEQ